MKVKQKGGNHAAQYNGKGRREHFEDIVGILDDGCNNKSTNRLDRHNRPYNVIVASQKALLPNRCRILDVHGYVGDNDTGKTHLNVSDPQRRAATLENLFKVHAGKSRRTGSTQDRHESDDAVLRRGIGIRLAGMIGVITVLITTA